MTDREIIDLFLAREEQAIMHTQVRYGRKIQSFSQNIVSNYDDALECENDTYVATWNSIPPNTPYEHFLAYLLKIVRNISLNKIRRKSLTDDALSLSEEIGETVPGSISVEEEVEKKALTEEINAFLRKQKQDKRVMFVKRYFEMKSVSEIAGEMACTETRVTTELSRIRKALKEYLESRGYRDG